MKMGPASGIPRNKRLQFHILRRCPKYASHAAQSNSPDVPPNNPTSLHTPAVSTAISSGQLLHPASSSVSLAPPSQTTTSTSTSQPTGPATSSAAQARPTKRPRPVLCKKKAGNLRVLSI